MYKIIVLFSLLAITNLVLSDDMQDLINMLHKTCVDETGVAEELVTKAGKGDFADDENLKCYTKCLFVQMACIDDNGIIDTEGVLALMPDDVRVKVEGAIRKCGTKVGANACENAWLTNKCYYEENPKNYFLP